MMIAKPSKQILITGGSGFIGSALRKQLEAKGHKLIVLTRNIGRAEKTAGMAQWIDNLDQIPPETPIDAIFNLAGENLSSGRWNAQRKAAFVHSRIDTTQALIRLIDRLQHKPEALISGSAIGFYGPQGDQNVDETTAPADSFSHRLCQEWENSAMQALKDCRVVLVRTGIVLGLEGGALKQMLTPFRLGLGGRLGSGKQWFSWIHRDDMVSLLIFCMENKTLHGAINATAPKPVTNLVFTQSLARSLHRPALLPMPAPIMRIIFGEMADELLLCSQKVLPHRAIEHDFHFQYPKLESALTQLLP